jgi:hypothetical protein
MNKIHEILRQMIIDVTRRKVLNINFIPIIKNNIHIAVHMVNSLF